MNRDRIEGLAVEPAVGQQLPASACVERLENSGSRSADKSEYEIVVGRMHHERVISVDVQTRHVIGQRSPVGRIDILPDSAVIPTEVYGRRVGGIGCRRLDAAGNLVEAAFRVDGRGSDWGPFCGAQRDDTHRDTPRALAVVMMQVDLRSPLKWRADRRRDSTRRTKVCSKNQ